MLATWFVSFPNFVGSTNSMGCETDTLPWRVTLYVKVTWPYKRPISSRDLYMLETWLCLFSWFVWSRKSIAFEPRTSKSCDLTTDLSKSRVKVTYLVHMLLTFSIQQTMETKQIHVSSMYRSRDKIGHLQGHVTLTYKVTHQGHVSGSHVIDLLDQTNHRNKKIKQFKPQYTTIVLTHFSSTIDSSIVLHQWMQNRLILKAAETEFIWLGSIRRLATCPFDPNVGEVVQPSLTVRDLGVIIDPAISSANNVARLARTYILFTDSKASTDSRITVHQVLSCPCVCSGPIATGLLQWTTQMGPKGWSTGRYHEGCFTSHFCSPSAESRALAWYAVASSNFVATRSDVYTVLFPISCWILHS